MLDGDEARKLLESIDTSTVVGLRDRALVALLIYTFARISAALHMNVEDYYPQGKRWWVGLNEKGGKQHDMPAHHLLETYIDAYLTAAGIGVDKASPLFRTLGGHGRKRLGLKRMTRQDARLATIAHGTGRYHTPMKGQADMQQCDQYPHGQPEPDRETGCEKTKRFDRGRRPMRAATPADILFILVVAFVCAFLLLWAGSPAFQTQLSSLPPYLTAGTQWIAGIMSGTAILSGVGAYLMGRAGQRPNYMANVLVLTGAMVTIIILIYFVAPWIAPKLAEVQLKFEVNDAQGEEIPYITVTQTQPWERFAQKLDIDHASDGDYYTYFAPYPNFGTVTKGSIILGTLNAREVHSVQRLEFCFGPAGNLSATRRTVRIACKDGSCSIGDESSAEIIHPCKAVGASQSPLHSSLSLFRSALAADMPTNAWVVPGLDVLNKASQGTGYTVFNITSEDFNWGRAASYTFEVRANGQPLYFDGVPPDEQILDVPNKKRLTIRFPIENLSFSGSDKGCENISVVLTILNRDGSKRTISMIRSYVALRNPPTVDLKLSSGPTVKWSGGVRGSIGQTSEVFIVSRDSVDEIEAKRLDFDKLNLHHGTLLLRGVIRPPYQDNRYYGLVVGEVQETGQIRFLFPPQEIDSILALVKQSGYADAFRSAATGVSPSAQPYDEKICAVTSIEER